MYKKSLITSLFFLIVFNSLVLAGPPKTIEVLIKGVDDGKKTTRSQDYKEAVMAAKLEAIERAGVEIKSVLEMNNFKLKYHYMESKAKGVLLPGFKVMDMGYQKDGTYQIVLSGKILRGGLEGGDKGTFTGDCSSDEERFNRLLGDLTSKKKIRKIVKEITTIPFDLNCGKVHFNAIAQFSIHKIDSKDYRHFLIKTAYEIDNPGSDRRAGSILRYLVSDAVMDEVEWKALLEIIKKENGIGYSERLYYLFRTDNLQTDKSYNIMQARLEELLNMAADGEIGKQPPEGYDQAFYMICRSIMNSRVKADRKAKLLYSVFSGYHERVISKPHSTNYKTLKYLYDATEESVDKEKVLVWMCDNFNAWPAGKRYDFTRDMWSFMKYLKTRVDDQGSDNVTRERNLKDFNYYLEKCQSKFITGLPLFETSVVMDKVTEFFIKNDLSAPGQVLSLIDLADNLAKEDFRTRAHAVKLLSKMGSRTIAVEDKIINLISKPKRLKGHKRYLETIRGCIKILGNSKTNNKRAHQIVVKYLKNAKYSTSDASQKAVLSFGQKLLPMILDGLNDCDIYVQMHIVRTISKMGVLTPASEKILNESIKTIKKERIKKDLQALFEDF